MPVPLGQYIDHEQLQRRLNRDVADQLAEALDSARLKLVDTFCARRLLNVDVNGAPVLGVNAERAIGVALGPLCALLDALERRARRT